MESQTQASHRKPTGPPSLPTGSAFGWKPLRGSHSYTPGPGNHHRVHISVCLYIRSPLGGDVELSSGNMELSRLENPNAAGCGRGFNRDDRGHQEGLPNPILRGLLFLNPQVIDQPIR